MADRVAHHVFQRAPQQVRVPLHEDRARRLHADAGRFGPRLEACIRRDLVRQFGQVELFAPRQGGRGFEPRERQQFADKFIHAHALALDALERGADPVRLLVRQPHRGLQPRQRRAQFVRDVVQQAALAVHQGGQACAHAVEVASQVAQLVPGAARAGEARGQVAARSRFEGAAQGPDRAREIPGQQGGEQQAGQGGGDDAGDLADAPARAWAAWRFARVAVVRRGHAGARQRRTTELAPHEGRVAFAVGAGQLPDAAARFARGQLAPDFGLQFGRHRAAQQLAPMAVLHEHLGTLQLAQHAAQGLDPAVLEGGGGRVECDPGRRAVIEFDRLAAGAVAQPEGAADADGGGDLGEQDAEEELPEQAAHVSPGSAGSPGGRSSAAESGRPRAGPVSGAGCSGARRCSGRSAPVAGPGPVPTARSC